MKEILKQRLQCSEQHLDILVHDLSNIDNVLVPLLQKWLVTGACDDDKLYEGYSITSLMCDKKMTFPAALLTVDWLIKDPKTACQALSEPIR